MNNEIEVGYTFIPVDDEGTLPILRKTPEESITIPNRTFEAVPDADSSAGTGVIDLPSTEELAEWEHNLGLVYGNFQDIAAEFREMHENPLGRYIVIALAVIAGIFIIKAVF